nr:hypothetical protein [Tanacetum cinerariifolium]
MGYDDNEEVIRIKILSTQTKKSSKSTKLRPKLKKLLPDMQKKLLNEKKKKGKIQRLSIKRNKTLADLGTWQDQISRHEGEVEFASLFKEVICTEIEQLNSVRDCLQALAEGRNEVISNEQKSIDELVQASKHGKDKVAKLDGKIVNGVGEMMRSQNKIIKIKKAIFKTKMQINLLKLDKMLKKILRQAKKGDY